MTRPDWCPQDVWEGASLFAQDWSFLWGSRSEYDGDAEQDMTESFARAILAERERCAAAVAALPGMGDTDCCGGFERCRDDAIEAIRGANT